MSYYRYQSGGCLTPNQDEHYVKAGTSKHQLSTNSILSPPLSPYQRNATIVVHNPVNDKSFIISSKPYKIENFKDYKMTINPWSNLSRNYKDVHLNFINQYNTMISSEKKSYLGPRRAALKRKLVPSDNDDDLDMDRTRTRRVVKTRDLDSDFDEYASPVPKKKAKPRKEPASGTHSPAIVLQQQLLIDESIPDYSPDPVATLPANNAKCLRIEWKGQPMDLSQDPNLAKLHPAEVLLASILRLPVTVYLDSKRRLFYEKVQRVKTDKQFRRTDAQKACRIDVNKASRLFAAFEKVGWLDDEHFIKYV